MKSRVCFHPYDLSNLAQISQNKTSFATVWVGIMLADFNLTMHFGVRSIPSLLGMKNHSVLDPSWSHVTSSFLPCLPPHSVWHYFQYSVIFTYAWNYFRVVLGCCLSTPPHFRVVTISTLIARFMGPIWGPFGAEIWPMTIWPQHKNVKVAHLDWSLNDSYVLSYRLTIFLD